MQKVVRTLKTLWKDESAQGATEYILLLVAVVAIAMMFGPRLKTMISEKVGGLENSVKSFDMNKN